MTEAIIYESINGEFGITLDRITPLNVIRYKIIRTAKSKVEMLLESPSRVEDVLYNHEIENETFMRNPGYKGWYRCLSLENKKLIDDVILNREDLQDFINNNTLL